MLCCEQKPNGWSVVKELLVVGSMNSRRANTKRNRECSLETEVGPSGRVHVEGFVAPADRNKLAAAVFEAGVCNREFLAPIFDGVTNWQNEVGVYA